MRVSVGVIPTTSAPDIVTQDIELVSWDHDKFPGIYWRIPDQTSLDVRYQDMRLIDGLRIGEFEKVVIVKGEKPCAIVPNGDWLFKGDIGSDENDGQANTEFIWVDMRQFEMTRLISGAPTREGVIDLKCGLLFKVRDPEALIRNWVLDENKLGKSIHGVLEDLIRSEVGKRKPLDLDRAADAVKEAMDQSVGTWGVEVMSVRLSALSPVGKERVPLVIREPNLAVEEKAQPVLAEALRREHPPLRGEKPEARDDEWERATKRWVPQARKGGVKCDGCGNDDIDWYADCAVICQSKVRCRLCKECFPKRRICALI
jgi:hypothetical protein